MGNIITSTKTEEEDIKSYLKKVKADFEERWALKRKAEKHVKYFHVNDYELMKTVGVGSFGRVMVCREKGINSFVAVKCLTKECIIESKQLEHTYSEYIILATIPPMDNLVNLISFGQDNANLYMAFEYVAGGELFSLLQTVGRIPEITATFYGAQVMAGLHYLHNLCILYRDLKPENILFTANGYLKLTDFGFAKRCTGWTFTLCGTPAYLAPEVILGHGYHKAVDWWSFGILMYEMVCGSPPFCSDNPLEEYNEEWLQKRHDLRMKQKGVRFNHSRFYGEFQSWASGSSKVEVVQSTQDLEPSTGRQKFEGSLHAVGGLDVKAGRWGVKTRWSEIKAGSAGGSCPSTGTSTGTRSTDPSLTSDSSLLKLLSIASSNESLDDHLEFPSFVSENFKDFTSKILQPKPTNRLGNLAHGPFDIKNHPLFAKVTWPTIFRQKVKAPWVPKVVGEADTQNYKDHGSSVSIDEQDEDTHATHFRIFPNHINDN